jgi:predicted aspartyl protease
MGWKGRRGIAMAVASAALVCSSCVMDGLSPATVPAQVGPGEVAFELAGPGGAAIVVPIRLNGEGPFNFVVDTGATFTCVDQELAERLKLPDKAGTIGFGAGLGGAGALRVVEIDAVEVGSARATNLTAAVIDLENIKGAGLDVHGLLGLNFLQSYRVTFDFERKVLELKQPGGPLPRAVAAEARTPTRGSARGTGRRRGVGRHCSST